MSSNDHLSSLEAQFDGEEAALKQRLSLFTPIKTLRLEISTLQTSLTTQSQAIEETDKSVAAIVSDINITTSILTDLKEEHAVRRQALGKALGSTGAQSLHNEAAVKSWLVGRDRDGLAKALKLAEERVELLKLCSMIANMEVDVAAREKTEVLPVREKLQEMKDAIGEDDVKMMKLRGDLDEALRKWDEERKKERSEKHDDERAEIDIEIEVGDLEDDGTSAGVGDSQLLSISQEKYGIINTSNHKPLLCDIIADAWTYQYFHPHARTDVDLFVNFYGVTPDAAWNLRSVEKLMDILKWRADIRSLYTVRSDLGDFATTCRFEQKLKSLLPVWLKLNERALRKYFELYTLTYDFLRGEHEMMKKKFSRV